MAIRRLLSLFLGSKQASPKAKPKPATEGRHQDVVTDPHCPYCGFEFTPPPMRKKRCPSCGNPVYVRTRPTDRKRLLVTFEQAEAIDGKPDFHTAQEARKAELMRYQSSTVVTHVRVITCKAYSCPSCQRLEGLKFTIEEALAKMPIPNPQCTWARLAGARGTDTAREDAERNPGWCRCVYAPVVDILGGSGRPRS